MSEQQVDDVTADQTDGDSRSRDELLAANALLAERNERLRTEYARAKRAQYRKTAGGLAGIGVAAVAAGLLFPSAQTVLFILGAIGLFGGLLTWYLTPERFIAVSVGREMFTAMSDTESQLVSELGLSDTPVFVPRETGDVRLFVPQAGVDAVPDGEDLDTALVATESVRGLAITPSGQGLLRTVETATDGPLPSSPPPLAEVLTEALVEQFELVDAVDVDLDAEAGRLTVAIEGSAYGPVTEFNHPVATFIAAGFATGLDEPVELAVADSDTEGESLVTCQWEL